MRLTYGTEILYNSGIFYIIRGDEITSTNSKVNALSICQYYEKGNIPIPAFQSLINNPTEDIEINNLKKRYGI